MAAPTPTPTHTHEPKHFCFYFKDTYAATCGLTADTPTPTTHPHMDTRQEQAAGRPAVTQQSRSGLGSTNEKHAGHELL